MSYACSLCSARALRNDENGNRILASFAVNGMFLSEILGESVVMPMRCTVTFPMRSTAGKFLLNRNVTMSNSYSSGRKRSVISFIAISAPPTYGWYVSEKIRILFLSLFGMLQRFYIFAHRMF